LQQLWRRDIVRSAGTAEVRTAKSLKKLTRLLEEQSDAARVYRAQLRDLENRLAQSDAARGELERRLAALERLISLDSRQAPLVEEWHRQLRVADVAGHAGRAVSDAPRHEIPGVLVAHSIFPPQFYELMLAGLPSEDFFEFDDPARMSMQLDQRAPVPRLMRLLWELVRTDVADVIARSAFQRLRPVLSARYEALFGRERVDMALALPHRLFDGRMVRCRPGYREKPHLDPKQFSITVLMHFAPPDCEETGGTALYTIDGDFAPAHAHTSYPEVHGVCCRFVSHVPFRPNSALVFVNGGVAHAMEIPETATGDRYAFQFVFGPNVPELLDFVGSLPVADQQQWLSLAACHAL